MRSRRNTAGAEEQRRRGALGEVSALAGAGVQFAVIIAACTAGGWWLDDRFDTSPWLLLAGALFGAVSAFYHLYRLLVAASDAQAREDSATHTDDDQKGQP